MRLNLTNKIKILRLNPDHARYDIARTNVPVVYLLSRMKESGQNQSLERIFTVDDLILR